MRDLVIITDIPIRFDDVSEKIKKAFKKCTYYNFDSTSIYLQNRRARVYIEFLGQAKLTDPINMMDETIDRVPNKDAFLTNLYYSTAEIAKKVIGLIKDDFGNMWIQSDEYDDWFGTADEFIRDYKINRDDIKNANLK